MTLVKLSKERLQNMRDSKWPSFLEDVNSFCRKHDISIIQMDEDYVPPGRSRRYGQVIKNLHQYQVELFYVCIDKQLAELNNRFDEMNMELLVCMSCLNPKNDFVAFDTKNLVRLAEFYPDDFSEQERMDLENQLEVYEMDMKSNDVFKELNEISSLSKKLVETGKDVVYNWVYKLIKLSLILPVATAAVERAFSAMNIVKSRLRNRMGMNG
ncbi:uncharacterized protein LOC113296585 [Papaver somniferum]|uniref:uncharacterized protein LOC113296585 n=1 Tax=Papaver somniferum TaxID=3469 RepID=UPI000E701704|nr:uncharacterized protein LOC113296585 [Papaver somniferum]